MSDVKNCARTLRSFMLAFLLSILVALPAAADERQALIVSGTEPPARINRALVLTAAEGPPVVLYAAENLTDAELEQFTVMAFVFKPDGTLTARQVAPGRRTLEPREVKYSTLVLDGTRSTPPTSSSSGSTRCSAPARNPGGALSCSAPPKQPCH